MSHAQLRRGKEQVNKQTPEIHRELCSLSSRISSAAYCGCIIFSFFVTWLLQPQRKGQSNTGFLPGTRPELTTLRFSCTLITYATLSRLFSLQLFAGATPAHQQPRRNCNLLHELQKEEQFHFPVMAILQNCKVKKVAKLCQAPEDPPLTAAW